MPSVDLWQDVRDNYRQFDRCSLCAGANFSLSELFDQLFHRKVAFVDVAYCMPTPLPNPCLLFGLWMQGHRRQLGEGYDWPPSPPESVGEDDDDDLPPMLAPQTTPLPFVEPPPVAEVSGPGKWQCWTKESNDLENIDKGMLRPISKMQGNLNIQNGHLPYYDHENECMLFITLEPKYDFGHEQWGQPFPKTYRFPVNIKKPTLWVYPTKIPVAGTSLEKPPLKLQTTLMLITLMSSKIHCLPVHPQMHRDLYLTLCNWPLLGFTLIALLSSNTHCLLMHPQIRRDPCLIPCNWLLLVFRMLSGWVHRIQTSNMMEAFWALWNQAQACSNGELFDCQSQTFRRKMLSPIAEGLS